MAPEFTEPLELFRFLTVHHYSKVEEDNTISLHHYFSPLMMKGAMVLELNELYEAECISMFGGTPNHSKEDVPELSCSCGFYGIDGFDMLVRDHQNYLADRWAMDMVVLAKGLYGGKTVQHERGYRSQFQVITQVWRIEGFVPEGLGLKYKRYNDLPYDSINLGWKPPQ